MYALLIPPHNPLRTAQLLSTYLPDTLFTTPSVLLQCAPSFPKEVSSKIRIVQSTGSPLTRLIKDELQKHLPRASFRSLYASAESYAMGYQCEFLAGEEDSSVYHPARENVYLEIVDDLPGGPPNGRASPTGEPGEIVISYVWKAPEPFIRYRTGEAAQWEPRPCPCGEPLTFKSLGRVNFDWVKIGGLLLYAQELERALGIASGGMVRDFQAILSEEKIGDTIFVSMRVLLLLHPNMLSSLNPDFTSRLAKNLFVSATATWSDCIVRGKCLPISIEVVDSLPGVGKPKRVLLKEGVPRG